MYLSKQISNLSKQVSNLSISTALGNVNIKSLLDGAALEEGGKLLLDFNDTMGDRIQVFLE